MKTRKGMLLILLLLVVAWMVWYWYPTLEPFIAHRKTQGFLQSLFLSSTVPGRAINDSHGMPTPAA